MQPSALEVGVYFVTSSQVMANPHFSQENATELLFDSLKSEVVMRLVEEGNDQWEVHLTVAHQPGEKENAPYEFELQLVGLFSVKEVVPEDKREGFAKVNGASVLYSVAREHLRVVTSAGPFPPIYLPTVSFVDLIQEPSSKS